MAQVRKQLVIYDFDWSMADQDTDRWIFEVNDIALRRRMKDNPDNMQWTDLVAQCCEKLHAAGGTREDIENALRVMPFHPAMIRAIKKLKSDSVPNTTLLCLSNANQVFIDTILEHRGLRDAFDEIITNPATWRSDGLLQVRRRIDPSGRQHSCQVGCSPNMCKGEELEAYLNRKGSDGFYDRMVYVGDGKNDFCPILRLREQDVVLARVGRGLEERIKEEGAASGLKARVIYWGGAWEVEELFPKLGQAEGREWLADDM
ncbi:hypothetical protein M407DRAFT_181183 [Tulasnella calospora MUT 4182]|uniref:Phosphatase phospho-type n=1 Tax=Tulasnella calospora MUT 4182 TaxID=1051891 RepID=A0A0C3L3Z5_9AGAM|nr:hypothetical protein M407DRAFT_181183 [Tulasnella calospora MUT 4182]